MTGELGASLRDLGLEKPMFEAKHPISTAWRFGASGQNDWWIPMTNRRPDRTLKTPSLGKCAVANSTP